jgi:hypothetical protein
MNFIVERQFFIRILLYRKFKDGIKGIKVNSDDIINIRDVHGRSFQPHYGPGVDSASNRYEYQESSWGVKGSW